ncbi:Alcohol dehydrogenase, zinc-binding domain protein [Limimaricola hongkongensis DSM 17492]|uniref:histidine kinase n=2 Tax=Limimaricola hongkongensis TaxID=278132 RepID=A0A017HFK2_9RHOB|nr:Alcohol dehydrogenase, zinc-binding domain protein [Limimaricola hongkongensis DSM 17492]
MTKMPLQLSPREVDMFIGFLDDGFCTCEMITDAEGQPVDYRFLRMNPQFEAMTGLYGAQGRTALDMVPGLEPFWIETYGRIALQGESRRFQQESAAMGRHFDVYATPIEPHGRFAIVFRDITETKRIEAEREAALAEAQQLLAELNHRVMNSLGTISSIIAMESRARAEGEGREALGRIRSRVHAVASLYRRLNASGSIESVCSRDYLDKIVEGLASSIGRDGIGIEARIAPVRLSTRIAVPLGLIVNELVTNSLKYAFAPGTTGRVIVALDVLDHGRLQLSVCDDGCGLGPAARSDSGIGQQLVRAFAAQLGASPSTESGPGGTTVTVRFDS